MMKIEIPIEHKVLIKTDRDRVFRALATGEGLDEWFTRGSSVDEFEEYWENEIGPLEDIPEFVFVCKTVPVVENGDSLFCDIIGNIVDNGWEDMQESDLHGLEEFFAACKAFSEANKGVVSCQENYKQAVRVRQTREN